MENLNGSNFGVVRFNHPKEYLVSISGMCNSDRLLWIAFGTNINCKYGPFGLEGWSRGSEFRYNFTKSSFGGFYGTVVGSRVSVIGVYIKPLVSLDESETDVNSSDSE